MVGAGPVGLACAIALKRQGFHPIVFDKGALVNSLVGYPYQMEFFSTPDLLEIGGHPFPTRGYKPLREEALDYYRKVAFAEQLDLRLYESVLGLEGKAGAFTLHTSRGAFSCAAVVVATGFFDVPNRLNVPGDALPHVSHYYREPFAHVGQEGVVIGAKNSAAKAALSLYRAGARVTMVVRGSEISHSVKYWIRPDLLNRIAEGAIAVRYYATVLEITPEAVHLNTPDGPETLPATYVYALTGYRPDYTLLETLGIAIGQDPARTPVHHPATFETNRPGVYLAGTVCGGLHTSRWFIENGRFHAERIAEGLRDGYRAKHIHSN